MPLAAVLVLGAIPALAQEPRPEDARTAGIEAEPREADTPTAPATEQGNPSLVAPEAEQGDPPPAASTIPNPGVTGALFVLDDIVVEGAKHGSAEVVVSETLLTVGQSYSEAQLQQALNRVQRLPFVVKAEFALRKGSDRGRFLLVISISETWPVFAGADVTITHDLSGQGTFPEVGARVFLRGYNELAVAYRGDATFGRNTPDSIDPGLAVTFTRHNLLSKRLTGTGSLHYGRQGRDHDYGRQGRDHDDLGLSSNREVWTGTGKLAFAVTRASVVEGTFSIFDYSLQWSPEAGEPWVSRTRMSGGTLGWRFDSTDDPFVPRRGTRLALSVSYSQGEGRTLEGAPHALLSSVLGSGNWKQSSASAEATRIWPLKRGMSLTGKATLAASDNHFDGRLIDLRILPSGLYGPREERAGTVVSRSGKGDLEVGLLGTFLRRPASSTHFWWEMAASSELASFKSETRAGDLATGPHNRYLNGMVRLSIAARGRWGTARLSFLTGRTFWSKREWQ